MTFRLLVFRLLQRIFGEERVHLTTDTDRAMAKPRARAQRQPGTPQTLDEALEQLRDYCVPYFSSDFPDLEIPKEFWTIENDELFYQVLGFMPLHVPRELLHKANVPIGFKLAWPIFWLEDDYHFNGWTAISNAGEEILRSAIHAYRSIGMESEAGALEAARMSKAGPRRTPLCQILMRRQTTRIRRCGRTSVGTDIYSPIDDKHRDALPNKRLKLTARVGY